MAPWFEQSIDLIWEWAANFLQPRHSRLVRMWAIKHRLTMVELNRHFFQRHVPERAPPPPFPYTTQGLYRAKFRDRQGEEKAAWVLVGNRWHPFASDIEAIFDS
jgi:hypothetical protein